MRDWQSLTSCLINIPEEIPDEYLKEQEPELIDLKGIDIPDVWWTESIKEIEVAEKILEKCNISEGDYIPFRWKRN